VSVRKVLRLDGGRREKRQHLLQEALFTHFLLHPIGCRTLVIHYRYRNFTLHNYRSLLLIRVGKRGGRRFECILLHPESEWLGY
ncbi:hypothetical protein PFISCL1PPCAC_4382, partial [Pristionchus fissidentatus]